MTQNLSNPRVVRNISRPPLAPKHNQRSNVLCFYNSFCIRFSLLASIYTTTLININPISWLQSLNTISDNTTNIDTACIILNILDYTDKFIAHKDKLLIKAYKKTNTLCSYIKELIIALI